MTDLTTAPETAAPAFGTWQPIEPAPVNTRVHIRTLDGAEFDAVRDFDGEDEGGNAVVAWREADEGTAPECWSDGVCWAVNEDEMRSDPPVSWMPLPPAPEMKP